MIGYICSAITDFCVTFADDSNIVNLHNWSMGSLSGMTWSNVRMMTAVVAVTMGVTFFWQNRSVRIRWARRMRETWALRSVCFAYC